MDTLRSRKPNTAPEMRTMENINRIIKNDILKVQSQTDDQRMQQDNVDSDIMENYKMEADYREGKKLLEPVIVRHFNIINNEKLNLQNNEGQKSSLNDRKRESVKCRDSSRSYKLEDIKILSNLMEGFDFGVISIKNEKPFNKVKYRGITKILQGEDKKNDPVRPCSPNLLLQRNQEKPMKDERKNDPVRQGFPNVLLQRRQNKQMNSPVDQDNYKENIVKGNTYFITHVKSPCPINDLLKPFKWEDTNITKSSRPLPPVNNKLRTSSLVTNSKRLPMSLTIRRKWETFKPKKRLDFNSNVTKYQHSTQKKLELIMRTFKDANGNIKNVKAIKNVPNVTAATTTINYNNYNKGRPAPNTTFDFRNINWANHTTKMHFRPIYCHKDVYKVISKEINLNYNGNLDFCNKLFIPNAPKGYRFLYYTLKSGMCITSKFVCLYQQELQSSPKLLIPRSYILENEWEPFWEDFYVTSAISLLKYIVEVHANKSAKIISAKGEIPFQVFEFAIKECNELYEYRKRKSASSDFYAISKSSKDEWDAFEDHYYKMTQCRQHFKQVNSKDTEEAIVKRAKKMLNTLSSVCSDLNITGGYNIWLIKPYNSYGGRGIRICRKPTDIIKVYQKPYVVQKYIEHPLLVYNHKFDIRQLFLLCNSTNGLLIWLAKDTYLRFSGETYDLRKLNPSIHITNFHILQEYWNTIVQESAFPKHHMWLGQRFKQYLDDLGHSDVYETIIHPGIKQSIITATLINRDQLNNKIGMEFYILGADFVITPDFKPWLTEINSRPGVFFCTPVIKTVATRFLKGVIKVILEYNINGTVNTQDLEFIYQEKASSF